jgi:GDPmannose 4,6-dehydratase
MLQRDAPESFVIATGESHTLEELANAAFAEVGLDAKDHIEVDKSLYRPADISYSAGDPSRAGKFLGWKAETKMRGVVQKMIRAELGTKPS